MPQHQGRFTPPRQSPPKPERSGANVDRLKRRRAEAERKLLEVLSAAGRQTATVVPEQMES